MGGIEARRERKMAGGLGGWCDAMEQRGSLQLGRGGGARAAGSAGMYVVGAVGRAGRRVCGGSCGGGDFLVGRGCGVWAAVRAVRSWRSGMRAGSDVWCCSG